MPTSVIARFTDAFVGGFFQTMKERLIDSGLLVATLLYWLLSGKLSAHLWESLAPWIWVVSVIVVWHSIKTAIELAKHPLMQQLSSHIVSPSGRPINVMHAPNASFLRTKAFGLALALCALMAALSYFAYGKSHSAKQSSEVGSMPPDKPPQVNLAIFMKCDTTALPVAIPAMSRIRVVPVNESYMRTTSWGSDEIRNDGSKVKSWPDAKKLAEAKRIEDFGVFIYKCEISNHGTVSALDVAIPITFHFGEGHGRDVKFSPIISPLDAGRTETIYFVNDCPTNASGILPDAVSLQVIGEAGRRSVALNLAHRSVIDPIMIWAPTKIKWIGVTECR